MHKNTKFAEIPVGHSKSITCYIEQLELKIQPMMEKVDFSRLPKDNFQKTIQDYLAFEIKNEITDLVQKFNVISNDYELNVQELHEFQIQNLFTVDRGKITNLNDLSVGNCPIVSAYAENQGIALFPN